MRIEIEDNVINQLVLQHTLEPLGIPFHIANDGDEGFEAFERLDPLLVLMDISMPRMDGFSAVAMIRAIESVRGLAGRTPIIAITAHAMAGDRERCIASGMDDYVSKPVSPAALQARVLEWLDRSAAGFRRAG